MSFPDRVVGSTIRSVDSLLHRSVADRVVSPFEGETDDLLDEIEAAVGDFFTFGEDLVSEVQLEDAIGMRAP